MGSKPYMYKDIVYSISKLTEDRSRFSHEYYNFGYVHNSIIMLELIILHN